jgi:CYTH domain-containing protein
VDVDPELAAKLGFPKLRYVFVERERRWTCTALPGHLVTRTERITDLYVTHTNLRLREARPTGEELPLLRLTRKVDVDAETRLISSIYLQESEFTLLRGVLAGRYLYKSRHHLKSPADVVLAIDEFEGDLSGLMLLEAEFGSTEALAAFQPPSYVAGEVTRDARFTGGHLAVHGLPTRTAGGSPG